MRRFSSIALLFPLAACFGQNPFDKPPANVDDALRARVNAFYDFHVQGKHRQAEQLVADESKDDFYSRVKQKLEGYRIQEISYSDDYRKAKVTLLAKIEILFPGMNQPEVHEVPMPSYWKMANGQWVYYYNQDYLNTTPWGKGDGGKADARPSFKPVSLDDVVKQVSVDRTTIQLKAAKGSTSQFTITNSLPGSVSLALAQASFPGFEVIPDKTELKAGEKSVVTVHSSGGPHTDTNVRLLVQPVNVALDVSVTFVN